MPTYDYRCEANQQLYEVKHAMSLQIETWKQLCEAGGMDQGSIDPGTKVTRVISGTEVVKSSSLKNPDMPPCMSGNSCCGGGRCGF